MITYAVIYRREIATRSRVKTYSDNIIAICTSMEDADKIKDHVLIAPEDTGSQVYIRTFDTTEYHDLLSGDYKVFIGSYDKLMQMVSIRETKINTNISLNTWVENDFSLYMEFLALDFGDAERTFRDRLEYYQESMKKI